MPEMDGFEATSRIRALEKLDPTLPRTTIVALTAHALPGEREKCLTSGMDDFLPKPIRQDTLRNMLGRWLKERSAPQSIADHGQPTDELDEMKEMFGRDFPELATLFLDDTPKRIAALQQALQVTDKGELIRVAHALSGSASSMGASSLAKICKSFDAELKAGTAENIESTVKSIAADYAQVKIRLQSMM